MPNAELQAWVTLLKDICTGIAAFLGGIVAILGFDAWKKQLTANAERDLARRVLISVYKVRDVINRCRLYRHMQMDMVDVTKTKRLHDEQLAKLDEAIASLDAELLEAEAIWGEERGYNSGFRKLNHLVIDLKNAYSGYYVNIDPDLAKSSYLVLFAGTEDPDDEDEYADQLENTVKQIEDFLRPRLTLKQRRWWHRFKKRRKS